MHHLWLVLIAVFAVANSAQAQIKGSGSTFAAQLYSSWSQTLTKSASEGVAYEPSGSTAGVKAIQDRSADFGASDTPLTRAALDQAGLIQFPTAIGGVVILTNIPGIGSDKIKLDGNVLAEIYAGRIKLWNDSALKLLNPELSLPATPIVPIFRDSGSGTSNIFTAYLSKVSPAFKTAIGVTSNLKLAYGKGGKTSTDMTKLLQSTAGSVTYLDYAFAADLGLPMVQLKNQWGKFVSPNPESLQLAMRSADWEKLIIDQNPTFEMDLTDAGCPGCWPIASATYVLVSTKGKADMGLRVLDFFDQAFRLGDAAATKEGYVPLPSRAKSIISLSMRRWNDSMERAGGSKPRKRVGAFKESELAQTNYDYNAIFFITNSSINTPATEDFIKF